MSSALKLLATDVSLKAPTWSATPPSLGPGAVSSLLAPASVLLPPDLICEPVAPILSFSALVPSPLTVLFALTCYTAFAWLTTC